MSAVFGWIIPKAALPGVRSIGCFRLFAAIGADAASELREIRSTIVDGPLRILTGDLDAAVAARFPDIRRNCEILEVANSRSRDKAPFRCDLSRGRFA